MQQFWHFKCLHYDKIIIFQYGSFYEIFYEDAIICHKHLDLNWMGAISKLHVGFPNVSLNKYTKQLVDLGFKVCVVDQLQDKDESDEDLSDVDELEAMIPDSGAINKQNVAAGKGKGIVFKGRKIAQIMSKGLFAMDTDQAQDLLSYQSQWVLALKARKLTKEESQMKGYLIGIVLFDLQSMKIRLGQFQDCPSMLRLRTLMIHEKPVEIIYEKNHTPDDVSTCIKARNIIEAQIHPIGGVQELTMLKGISNVRKYFPSGQNIPDVIRMMQCDRWGQEMTWQAYAVLTLFLEKHLMAKETIPLCDYSLYSPEKNESGKSMLIDCQAVKHLQLVEVEGAFETKEEGSLFHFIAHTQTRFGKRLLRKWICSPLTNIAAIQKRQDVIQDLMKYPETIQNFYKELATLPDIERILGSIYQQSVGSSRIYNNNLPIARLQEFYALLANMKHAKQAVAVFTHVSDSFNSKYLKRLVTYSPISSKKHKGPENPDEIGLFPDIDNAVSEFEALVQWQQVSFTERVPEPVKGFDKVFDAAKTKTEQIQKELNNYLKEVRKDLGYARNYEIKYVHSKYPYEIEIPKEQILGDKRPENFEFTSQRIGFQRFITPELRSLTKQLERAQKQTKKALIPFICSMFAHFHSKKKIWQRIVACLSELDCYCALAIFANNSQGGAMCKPQFIDPNVNKPMLELIQMRHPSVTLTFKPGEVISKLPAGGGNSQSQPTELSQQDDGGGANNKIEQQQFIPNDTILGNKAPSIMLVTGPNMGGKSTLLRQTCLAVILAQMGSFVPAESCTMTPVDKVFTRIGAQDRILEGKSTFYVEMEETKAILNQATRNSLVIIDELGRGTSTFDGQAIAEAVLNYIVKRIKCNTLFSTHYHVLQEKYMTDNQDKKGKVQVAKMDYKIEFELNKLIYLYKLTKGPCPSSFGLNIAQIAGLPKLVLDRAKTKSIEFQEKYTQLQMKHVC